MQILCVSELVGYLPDEAAKAINQFTKDYDKPLNESNFYILGHREYFKEKYENKECGTYIIFFREYSDKSREGYATIEEDTVVTQIYSSGNDFSLKRQYIRYFNWDVHSKNGTPSMIGHIIFGILYLIFFLLSTIYDYSFESTFLMTIFYLFSFLFLIGDAKEVCNWNTN